MRRGLVFVFYSLRSCCYYWAGLWFFSVVFVGGCWAQAPIREEKKFSPNRALVYAFVLPGSGQVYNRQLWKLPLLAMAGVALGYETIRRKRVYEYASSVLKQVGDTPNALPEGFRDVNVSAVRLSLSRLRRDRDLFYVLCALFYGLQAVEAFVSAHLLSFDTDQRLAKPVGNTASVQLRLVPYMNTSALYEAGLRLQVSF